MRILSAIVKNFASYDRLEFNFTGQGLTLISGPTGAGKSTLCDIIPWVLFGVTSKNGAVDEIRRWGESTTEGTIYLENSPIHSITRIRSKGASSDLYYEDITLGRNRGKDLADTQKIINEKLGLHAELYLSGAYFHEFSQTASFFTTTAKHRRELTEQLAALSLAVRLVDNITMYKREAKKEKDKLETDQAVWKGKIEQTRDLVQNAKVKAKTWQHDQKVKIERLEAQSNTFDSTKAARVKKLEKEFNNFEEAQEFQSIDFNMKAEQLTKEILPVSYFEEMKINTEILIDKCGKEKCKECGNALKSDKKMFYMKQLKDWEHQEASNNQKLVELKLAKATLGLLKNKSNPYADQISAETQRENTFTTQVNEARAEKNPYTLITDEHITRCVELQGKLDKNTQDVNSFLVEIDDLDTLSDVVDEFRGALIKNTVLELENSTNEFLTNYFDAEIRVGFAVESADKLMVNITKDGNSCTFTQLSKGQRQLLKLCFGASVMKRVANHNGVSFNAIFLDEFADGLDENLKVKAYRLLEYLATQYESVFAIDHSETLKSMFNRRYNVTLENGNSRIEEA